MGRDERFVYPDDDLETRIMWILYVTDLIPAAVALILLILMFADSDGPRNTVLSIVIFFLLAFFVFLAGGNDLLPASVIRYFPMVVSAIVALRFITLKCDCVSEKIIGLIVSVAVVLVQLIMLLPI